MTIKGLCEEVDAGMTPVREAIRRLTAEGALEFLGNRRVCVPELTLGQLDELGFARCSIEPRLAFLATANLTPDIIAELEAIDAALNRSISLGDIKGYLANNHAFHLRLYEAADAGILMSIAHTLLLRVGPSLRVVCGRFGTFQLPDLHEEALAAMRRGDAEGVANAIEKDLIQGIEQVRQSIDES